MGNVPIGMPSYRHLGKGGACVAYGKLLIADLRGALTAHARYRGNMSVKIKDVSYGSRVGDAQ